jgi:hypothetical protein
VDESWQQRKRPVFYNAFGKLMLPTSGSPTLLAPRMPSLVTRDDGIERAS